MVAEAKTLADLGWAEIAAAWAGRCHTERGAARAQERASAFDLEIEEARAQLVEIGEAGALRQADAPLPFGAITDVRLALARCDKGSALAPEELIAVARAARACARLAAHIAQRAELAPALAAIAAAIEDLGHVYHPILESFDDEGRLVDHASDALGGLRRRVTKLIADLERKARGLIDDPGMAAHLQDRFYTQRDDRYVVPIKVESRGRVQGIVHGTSGSGQTVFIEPQVLVELNNQLRLAECEVADEERRIYARLSGFVAEETGALRRGLEAATRLDVTDGAARLAEELEATVPALDQVGALELPRARHPLMLLAGKLCVANDVVLESGRTLVISGPNAGGKTVALKTAGLAALMARAGLPVCAAPGSRVPWFDRVASDIGDSQSLEQDLSTFSARLLRVGEFLNRASERSLLLIDEIAVGTEPEQGAALAQSVLEALADRGATTIVTTHYERLKLLAGADDRFVNASVGFDVERMEPTFVLAIGVPGSSGALAVARRMGLARTVVDRAEALLGDRRVSVEALIESLEEARRQLETEGAALVAARSELAEALRRAETAEARARAREKSAAEGAHSEAVAALKAARRELESARERVRKRPADRAAIEADVDRAAKAVVAHAPPPEERGRAPRPGELAVGAEVWVRSLSTRGTLLEDPSGDHVAVAVGSLRTRVPLGELRVEPGRTPPAKKSVTVTSPAPKPSRAEVLVRTDEATLDLRGRRAEEAEQALDRFVDQSLLAGRSAIFIIHGHGTGALRTAVRAYFASSPAIAEWRPGEQGEGGDGVTVAWLDV
jgi:DNA mismatch repair protein MutS2